MSKWDRFTGADAARRSQENIREKLGFEKGLSRQTMDAVQAGEIVIVDDDPQAELLKQQGGQDS